MKLVFFQAFLLCFHYLGQIKCDRSFSIDYDNNTFLKDSVPFRYISGSIHPYRVPRDLWSDRLTKMWAAGLNAIQVYVFWEQHEVSPGVYDFEGQNNIFDFFELAQKIGFVIVLRPGPYVCAETDFGGLPWWLMAYDFIEPRSSEQNYMSAVERWLDVLFPRVFPYLYKNGGPIITVQIENEYGFYYTCDLTYKTRLRDIFIQHLGNDVVYFTTDPPSVLKCGAIPNVYSTVDFGVGTDPSQAFSAQREYSPKGPLVNSEFYPGWLDHWGERHQKLDTSTILQRFNEILSMNANVNFYMFHGGTNFGFSNGANGGSDYSAQPTSYDYDAPISEAGDITDKYMAIRSAISKYMPLPSVPIPSNSSKIAYGKVQMQYLSSLKDLFLENKNVSSKYPLSFEKMGQGYGVVMYSTILDDPNVDGKTLSIPGLRDRAYVQIGDTPVGILYREGQTEFKINLTNNTEKNLYIFVENMGRLNFGNNIINDTKGINSNVTLDGSVLSNWVTYLNFDWIPNFQKKINENHKNDLFSQFKKPKSPRDNNLKFKAPALYVSSILFSAQGGNNDTFLKMDKFTKGFALIQTPDNLFNLGRYWPNKGPQVTLYTPGVFTSPISNLVYLFEFEGSSCETASECFVEFIDYPIIDSLKV